MHIPADSGFLLKKLSSKHRSWIKSRQKKLLADFDGRVSWHWIKDFEDLDSLCNELEEVAAKTYQRGLGAGFFNNEEFRQRYRLFADQGSLRIQLIRVENRVKAFWIGKILKDVFYSEATGYDPDFRIYELGTLLLLAITDALVEEGVQRFDFGLGDAFYKERFSDESWTETSFHLFAPTIKGAFLRGLEASFGFIDQKIRQTVRKAGWEDRVKTGWRRLKRDRKGKAR